MANNIFLDFNLMDEVPNKYCLRVKDISKLIVKDWDKLYQHTWLNTAMPEPCYCHLEGCNKPDQPYNDENEFWIGFYPDGRIRYHFTCYGGMCNYKFSLFYKGKDINNWMDMQLQVNTLRFLNMLLDEGIVELEEKRNNKEKKQ